MNRSMLARLAIFWVVTLTGMAAVEIALADAQPDRCNPNDPETCRGGGDDQPKPRDDRKPPKGDDPPRSR